MRSGERTDFVFHALQGMGYAQRLCRSEDALRSDKRHISPRHYACIAKISSASAIALPGCHASGSSTTVTSNPPTNLAAKL